MPKFTDAEKVIIKQKLLQEGERLFTLYGIKKVSIDEIVQATGIAKGSFYSFYASKEHLFMEIIGNLQCTLWKEMDGFLYEHQSLPPRELCKQYILLMFQGIDRYPLLKQMNHEMSEYLLRKLPREAIEAHTKDDMQELVKLQAAGIHFKYDLHIVTTLLQTMTISFLNLQQESDESSNMVMEVMLNGVLKEIMDDENN